MLSHIYEVPRPHMVNQKYFSLRLAATSQMKLAPRISKQYNIVIFYIVDQRIT